MSKEIFLAYGASGYTTIYSSVRNPSNGQWWYTVAPAFENFNASHIASGYAIPMTEEGTTGDYYANFPTGISSAGEYNVYIRNQQGVLPAWPVDQIIGSGPISWSGSNLVTPGALISSGLDSITTTEPDTVTNGPFSGWNFRQYLRWVISCYSRGTRSLSGGSGNLIVDKIAGTTSTTQAITDDGAGNETLGPPT